MLASWSFRRGEPASGFNAGVATDQPATAKHNAGYALTVADLAERLESWTEPPPGLVAEAAGPPPNHPGIPEGSIVYVDPPYVGTTGYDHDLPRAEVVRLSRAWHAAGATVAISEAEPIADLVAEGWHAVNLSAQRFGQARTFSRQKEEWLTLSRTPAWTPGEQQALW